MATDKRHIPAELHENHAPAQKVVVCEPLTKCVSHEYIEHMYECIYTHSVID